MRRADRPDTRLLLTSAKSLSKISCLAAAIHTRHSCVAQHFDTSNVGSATASEFGRYDEATGRTCGVVAVFADFEASIGDFTLQR